MAPSIKKTVRSLKSPSPTSGQKKTEGGETGVMRETGACYMLENGMEKLKVASDNFGGRGRHDLLSSVSKFMR